MFCYINLCGKIVNSDLFYSVLSTTGLFQLLLKKEPGLDWPLLSAFLSFWALVGWLFLGDMQICLSSAGISFSLSTLVFNSTRLSISDLPQMSGLLKTCSKDFSQITLFIQLPLFLPVDQLYWLGCHYQNHHTKFLLTLIKMHVQSMTKSVHFPCLCVQTASYIHTFLFPLNLLPQTEFIFCLAFYVRNTHHVI